MSEPGIKSKPNYPGLEPDTSARQHLLIGEADGAGSLARTLDGLIGTANEDTITVLYTPGDGSDHSSTLTAARYPTPTISAQLEDVITAMQGVLRDARMGTRMYVAGSEPFIWAVIRAARELGMAEAAIQRERCGLMGRSVICVHCKTTAWRVSTTIYQCPGCELHLFVRDHFSRRWGVYQGVCVDAEAPGEVPEPEELEP